MNELLLIVSIGGRRAALIASEVHSVVELESLSQVPRTPAHVAGLSALRSRVLTVIDCRASLELQHDGEAAAEHPHAAVVEHEGHLYALRVDGIEDVVAARSEVTPMRTMLGRGWDRVALGMIESDLGALLLVDVAALISGPDEARAA